MKIFEFDGPVFRFISTLVDLIFLNILIVIFSIPIITIGAAFTAGHFTALKMRRGEGTIVKTFWKSFKVNFVQSTILEIVLAVLAVMTLFLVSAAGGDLEQMESLIHLFILFFWVCIFFTAMWAFPLQARFINPLLVTLRNAYGLSVRHMLRTIYMLIVYLLPIVLVVLNVKFISIVVLFGISGPIYISVLMYNKIFEKLEDDIKGVQLCKEEMEKDLHGQ